ncbi:hypothetical protein [Streptomyces sp. NPDC060194]|uniref:hypothetical protein n=1 Tax=Streptomyces sp. NPDC060194 TaxID=3347069 RepID=UPI00364F3625
MSTNRPAVVRKHPPEVLMKIVNPVMRRLIARGGKGPAEQLLLLHFTGRRSGRSFEVPAARQELGGGEVCVLTNSAWRVNFRGGADIEVTDRGERRPVRAALEEDPAAVAAVYTELLGRLGYRKANRLGISLTVDRPPTREELEDAARRYRLSVVRLTPRV